MKTLKNIVYQLINLAGSKVLMYIFFIVLARLVSVDEFGQYNYIMTYSIFWSILMDFGFEPYITRQVAAGEDKGQIFSQNLSLKLVFLTLGFAGLVALSPLFMIDNVLLILMAGTAFAADSMTRFLYAFVRGAQDLKYESIITFCQKVVFVFAGVYLLFLRPDIFYIFLLLTILNVIFFFIVLILVLNKYSIKLSFRLNWNEYYGKIKYLLPFFIISIFSIIYFKIDIFMLKYFGDDYQVGIYSAAFRLLESFQVIPSAILVALFPSLVSTWLESEEKFKKLFEKVLSVLLGASLVVVTGGWLYGDIIIKLLYGSKYTASIAIFNVLLIAILFMFINYLLTQTLIALEKQTLYSRWVISCALFNAGVNILLIPLYGPIGAAIATGLTEFILFLLILPTLKIYFKAVDLKYNVLLISIWAIVFVIGMIFKEINTILSIIIYLIISLVPIKLLIDKYMPIEITSFFGRKTG